MVTANVTLKDAHMVETKPLEDHAASYLPADKKWTMVWNDEFDGEKLDESKWNFRRYFWGHVMETFTDEGVTFDGDSHMRINLIRKGDDFYSAHLQTGSLTMDIPASKKSGDFWPFGKKEPAKFMHRYGYYEIRCRLPKHDGWHAAFWLQSPSIGVHPDPAFAGVECDIMENYRQHTENLIVCGCGWDGYGEESKWYGHFKFPYEETEDGWHYYGVDWTPEGYIFYADGQEVGRQMAPKCAVSQVDQFVLVTTECHGYRRVFEESGKAGKSTKKAMPVPQLFEAGDDYFEVDFVRVYDEVKE